MLCALDEDMDTFEANFQEVETIFLSLSNFDVCIEANMSIYYPSQV